VRLPDALRTRLLAATQINALTEIEAVIAELKTLDAGMHALAKELEDLLSRYDMDAITALLNQIPTERGQA
jgi:hypothetical protein